ncbi:hypothetical protein [Corynebacterium oculi]|uniref:hypothetical protein n=1 Tax=Corynebacterium oculi TaxID=1544416 RepID=UPI0006D8A9E8|nr:hypothetical protein [Corynebacterium oculi]
MGGLADTVGTIFSAIRNIPKLVKEALTGEVDVNEEAMAGLYDSGGVLQHGSLAVNLSGKPEAVLTYNQWDDLSRLLGVFKDIVPGLERVPYALEELAVSYRDGVGLLGDAVRGTRDNPLARAAGHLAGPWAALGKSAFETYSNLEPSQVMGNLAHGVVTGHLEDAAGLLGIPTEKPAWLDAAEQFRAAIPGAMTSARGSLASSIEKAKGKSQAAQAGAVGLSDGGQAAKESGLAPVPEAVETAAQGKSPQGEGQDWASFAAGILGAGSVMELGRNAMHGGIELASMGPVMVSVCWSRWPPRGGVRVWAPWSRWRPPRSTPGCRLRPMHSMLWVARPVRCSMRLLPVRALWWPRSWRRRCRRRRWPCRV